MVMTGTVITLTGYDGTTAYKFSAWDEIQVEDAMKGGEWVPLTCGCCKLNPAAIATISDRDVREDKWEKEREAESIRVAQLPRKSWFRRVFA